MHNKYPIAISVVFMGALFALQRVATGSPRRAISQ